MKKLVFMFVAFVAMTFAACGGQTASTASVNDSDSVAAPTYNIMGMKTNKNRKGIYISKGKKFIIR